MARRQRKKRKVLAGFARATGDRALTASIHDLVVLPELQGLGLGRKLLAKATNQVTTLLQCTFAACSLLCCCRFAVTGTGAGALQQESAMPVMLLIGATTLVPLTPSHHIGVVLLVPQSAVYMPLVKFACQVLYPSSSFCLFLLSNKLQGFCL